MPITEKLCSSCGLSKSLNCFYRNHTKRDGVENQCKPCHARYATTAQGKAVKHACYQRNAERIKLRNHAQFERLERSGQLAPLKKCPHCGITKRREAFYRHANRPDGLVSQCIDCFKKMEKASASKHGARKVAAAKRWNEHHPEQVREVRRKYKTANRRLYAVHESARRARGFHAKGHASVEQVEARIAFYGGMCWLCRINPGNTIDHVIPLSRGGSLWPSNVRPACTSCNSRKGNRRVVIPFQKTSHAATA